MHGKSVVVTGGAGFIGSNLCKRLAAEGCRVICVDNYFSGSRANHVGGVEYREGHTKDLARLVPETPDLIYHLGEYARVEQSLLEPDVVRDLNVTGTDGVIAYWQQKKCKLVYAGSSTKFGDGGMARHTTPYAETKAANTERIKHTGDAEHLPYAIVYFYNVYGAGERAGVYGTVIEAFKQMYLHGTPLAVTSPGTQTRNFTHVDDIVDALLLVGERGQGDEYGLGNEKSFSLLDVARLFGGELMMLPERAGNRMQSGLDAVKIHALGWNPKRSLETYIADFMATHARGAAREKRVLVFSTTFYPTVGPAEEALMELIRRMPSVQFDVITTVFTADAKKTSIALPNVAIHRVGMGNPLDKYLLPVLGFVNAQTLLRQHTYLFAWSLMASYAALAGILLKRMVNLPLLITLADQNLAHVRPWMRLVLKQILTDADQVYGFSHQEQDASQLVNGALQKRSFGEGDAFANQLRYAYAEILMTRLGAEWFKPPKPLL
jgi:UDP-glucose 4-epimerase